MPDYFDFAKSLAQKAGEKIRSHFGQYQTLEYKQNTDFKTKVDDDLDLLIRSEIQDTYPSHNIMSEENEDVHSLSEFTWVIDPLDGTLNFTYGSTNHFSTSIALYKNGLPFIGVVFAPLRNEMYAAQIGLGAFLNNEKIECSPEKNINKALVALDYGKTKRRDILSYQSSLLGDDGVAYTQAFCNASVPMALVASGKLNAYFSLNLDPWDMAAAVVINLEAGAKVTNIYNQAWSLKEPSVLVANVDMHSLLIAYFSR